jgi:sucrose phosphorylase
VQRLVELIRFRNRHPAFEGEFTMPSCPETELILTWRRGPDWATLSVDLARVCAVIGYSTQDGERFWNITEEAQ